METPDMCWSVERESLKQKNFTQHSLATCLRSSNLTWLCSPWEYQNHS
jgi:hypothetical protein